MTPEKKTGLVSRAERYPAIVEPMPSGEALARRLGPCQRRIRGAWRILHRQWDREDHSHVDRLAPEPCNGHHTTVFPQSRQILHQVRRLHTIGATGSNITDQRLALPQRWEHHLPILVEKERIPSACHDGVEGFDRDQRPRDLRGPGRACGFGRSQ